jgi:hypothetical protein
MKTRPDGATVVGCAEKLRQARCIRFSRISADSATAPSLICLEEPVHRSEQFLGANGFRGVAVHACVKAALLVFFERVGRHGNDRYVAVHGLFAFADERRGLKADRVGKFVPIAAKPHDFDPFSDEGPARGLRGNARE